MKKAIVPILVTVFIVIVLAVMALPNFVKARGHHRNLNNIISGGADVKTPENLESDGSYDRDGSPSYENRAERKGGGWTWYDPGTRPSDNPDRYSGSDSEERWQEYPDPKPYDMTFFENYGVNPFIPADIERFSTFAMDVDTASYTIARRYLDGGNMPEKDAIRTEEFINYFDLEYPDEDDYFSILLEGAESEFGDDDSKLLLIGVKANELKKWNRKPANIIFVIDKSGSMGQERRLQLVKRSINKLADGIHSGDRLALAVFDTKGRLLSDLTSDRDRIYGQIDNLYPSGTTNVYQGLSIGYQVAERHYDPSRINMVILCSDGVANTQLTNPDQIVDYVIAETKKGITLSVIGFGMGNYNDVLLETIADKGDGKYYYIDTDQEADRLFADGAVGMFETLASDAKIQVEFNPATVDEYRLLGYENRRLNREDFRDDYVDAGEIGPGQSVTALYEVRLKDRAYRRQGEDAATVRIRYHNNETDRIDEKAKRIRVSEISGQFMNASPQFRFTASVAEFAEILKDSYWAQDGNYNHVIDVAEDAIVKYPKLKEEREFVELVKGAQNIDVQRIASRWR